VVRFRWINRSVVFPALALVAALVFVFDVFPRFYVSPSDVPNKVTRLKAQNDVRLAGIQAVGILIALTGAIVGLRQFTLQRYTELEKQLDERVQQLGADELEVRLRALRGLRQLALGSRQHGDQVRETLSSGLVRQARPDPSTSAAPQSRPHADGIQRSIARRPQAQTSSLRGAR
jgi:hypothetical protein